MPETCNAPQNREDAAAGRAINENPRVTFHPITDADKQTAQEKLQVLIGHSRRELDCLNNED